jgi:hypothetical protein
MFGRDAPRTMYEVLAVRSCSSSSSARDARADLLARAAVPLDIRAVPNGRPMLLEADPGDDLRL